MALKTRFETAEARAKLNAQRRALRKQRKRDKILYFLADPETVYENRLQLAELLKCSKKHLYKTFPTEEISAIEQEALKMRRERFAAELSQIDSALLNRALTGDVAAIKLAYQKFEGWNEKQGIDISGGLTLAQLAKQLEDKTEDTEDKG